VKLLRGVLRLYAYAFSVAFVAAIFLVSVVILLSDAVTVNFYLFPWEGKALLYSLIALALMGALIVIFTWRGKMQTLFLAWTVLILALIVRFFFFTPFSFTPGSGGFQMALLVILAALIAAGGAAVRPQGDGRNWLPL
jgi:hypothetical protein